MKKKLYLSLGLLLVILLYAGSFVFSYSRILKSNDPLLITDVARLIPLKVHRVDTLDNVEDLKKVLAEAKEKKLKVSISGSKHSQGGHTYYQDAIVLDMSSFNKILDLDVEKKIIRVQSGAKWKDVQEYINPYKLAVKVMQSSYVFTIGGTLSANAHGRDLDMSSVVETVRSFRLLNANGEILNFSRTENPELFRLVIGGYGLFGVILDVDIELTNNDVYEQKSVVMDYKDFPEYFQKNIKDNSEVEMMLVRPSIATDTFLRELVVATWNKTDKTKENIYDLTEEENVMRDKFVFGLSRKYTWAKNWRWNLQKKIETGVGEARVMSRTNAMRPPLAPLELLDYYSSGDTDILQEYFIPVRNFMPFMDEFREILLKDKVNTISFTIRYVKANNETYMAYAPTEDAFAIIYMTNVSLSEKAQEKIEKTTQKIVDTAIKNSGTYYLTYQLYPTKEQMRKAYPNTDLFFAKKLQYDPSEMFMNKFYEKYAK
ncbi:MAG: FAD-binding oxidoreductase [Bacteroidetes bacterium]|nr:FAD-binding oxidoreductase [Bacteroidota bacterium]